MLESLFVTLLEISVTAGIIILVLKLLSPLFNKVYGSKLKYWIWLVLALRLIIPVNFSFPMTPVEMSIPDIQINAFTNPVPAQPNNIITPPTIINPVTEASQNSLTLIEAAMIIWIIGCMVFLLYQIAGYFVFKKKALRWSKAPTDPRIVAAVCPASTDLGLTRNITLLISESVSSPLMIGFTKPIFILPHEDYSDTDIALVMRHELTHCKRNDMWYKLLLVFVNAIHWFNPLVYLMFREASADLELSCDDEVIKGVSFELRREYSETILGEVKRQKIFQTSLSTYFFGGQKRLKSRFQNILNTKKRRNGAIALVITLLAITLVSALVACQVSEKGNDAESIPPLGAENTSAPKINAEEIDGDLISMYYKGRNVSGYYQYRDGTNAIVDILNSVSPTTKKSVNDVPPYDRVIKVELLPDKTVYLYQDNGKYYAEMPYVSIGELTKEAYEKILELWGPIRPFPEDTDKTQFLAAIQDMLEQYRSGNPPENPMEFMFDDAPEGVSLPYVNSVDDFELEDGDGLESLYLAVIHYGEQNAYVINMALKQMTFLDEAGEVVSEWAVTGVFFGGPDTGTDRNTSGTE